MFLKENPTQMNPKTFDLLTCPLKGTNLIEASAGTGKTYAITGLFLRLLLEEHLPVNEILVVTFTEAATEELKDRIRSRLLEAVSAFTGKTGQQGFAAELAQATKYPDPALERLKEALRMFDEACIYTIHGFCRRVLHENAFESGSLFDTELVTEQDDLKREITEDFWRVHFYGESPLFVNYVIQQKITPGSLSALLGNQATNLDLKIIPDLEMPGSVNEETAFREAFDRLARAWPDAKGEVSRILLNHDGLNRNQYKANKIFQWIQAMDRWVGTDGPTPVLFEGFSKFCAGDLEKAVKKNHRPPDHSFFGLAENLKIRWEALIQVYEKRLLALKVKLFHDVNHALEQKKQKKNIQFFDDLLLKLHQALHGAAGHALARNIRNRYKAALIDEFQDTDPVQYAIFKQIFSSKESVLFLIGDPKQAIYGFRGADIFAYMDAAGHSENRYTLKENWRSEPGLIAAVNALFGHARSPFIYDEIPFHPVVPANQKDFSRLTPTHGEPGPSLELWLVNADQMAGSGKAITKSAAKEMIPHVVAEEISRLLFLGKSGHLYLGESALRENHIAVLVRENTQAHLMQQALSDRRIHSVIYTTDSLFSTHEALEMERVLQGIARVENEQALRVLLTTDMFGLNGEDLYELTEDESRWEQWIVKIRGYHRQWEESGLMAMFEAVCRDEDILPRLMSFPDGERRCTNLLHLSEVLYHVVREKKPGMTGLVKWLSEKRHSRLQRDEAHQLRLESDETAVSIVTTHRSKGLQYPVVFCPFTWGGIRKGNTTDPVLFHDTQDRMRPTLDLGSDQTDEHRRLAEQEALAEDLRLLYVALTRAKNRCYLVWGRFNQAETSAPAYLFHQPESTSTGDLIQETCTRYIGMRHQEMVADLEKITAPAGGAVQITDMPETGGPPAPPAVKTDLGQTQLTCREFRGRIDQHYRICSFSAMASDLIQNPETADHDAMEAPEPISAEGLEASTDSPDPFGIFTFPRGPRAGTFMHDLFEHFDFVQTEPGHGTDLVTEKLSEYGFESFWFETIHDMIQKVLSVPLCHDRPELTLSRIPCRDRINELEFYFPLQPISPGRLKEIFEQAPGAGSVREFPEQLGNLNFSWLSGFMKGFIDMIFQFQGRIYLVDWKSNHLGDQTKDYDSKGIDRAMKAGMYILQYHIYCVALNQYLKVRLPDYEYEKHFGGVFYLFLRGMDPAMGPDFGIYRDRPSKALIHELARVLIGGD